MLVLCKKTAYLDYNRQFFFPVSAPFEDSCPPLPPKVEVLEPPLHGRIVEWPSQVEGQILPDKNGAEIYGHMGWTVMRISRVIFEDNCFVLVKYLYMHCKPGHSIGLQYKKAYSFNKNAAHDLGCIDMHDQRRVVLNNRGLRGELLEIYGQRSLSFAKRPDGLKILLHRIL